ncbi:uncharacterized protein EV422DRAFT_564363 [Fimicolochytrium jonesii]|uniref:uncharacterized protein n=1 Tax=Fimicolochytrium jonesii TaxID=1396493 RepID=UPI0022FEA094|nr:uncharacterized protein EV422DRAFT_564363 [Fimicolochytrium jonesii]KAI8825008.1 hypothetical protein EV422DRAFT_564363 [Fimicolochytrium jonesii]
MSTRKFNPWAWLLLVSLAIFVQEVMAGGYRPISVGSSLDRSLTGTGITTIRQRVLVLTTTEADTSAVETTLKSYSIPYDVVIVPKSGYVNPDGSSTLPLEDASRNALYSMTVLSPGRVPYQNPDTKLWISALTTAQWDQLAAFEVKNKVRRVTLDDNPGPTTGTAPVGPANAACCASGVTQNVSYVQIPDVASAGLVNGATFSTTGLYHYPATITNSTTTAIATLGPSSDGQFPTRTVVGVLIKYPNGREQMTFFMAFGWWSTASLFFGHLYVHWGTRQLYSGFRRIYLNMDVDDVLMGPPQYRITPADVQNIVAWQTDVNKRLPTGSSFRLTLAYNGVGAVQAATPTLSVSIPVTTPNYNFIKSPGTGTNYWPAEVSLYKTMTHEGLLKDGLYAELLGNTATRDQFWWCSHTFTHLSLDQATRSDTNNELEVNTFFAGLSGLLQAAVMAKRSMVTPMITGIHNVDALQSLIAHGYTSVVGDTTRGDCTNATFPYHPYVTTIGSSNHAGYEVIPRQATVIYFNCSLPEEDVILYNNIYYKDQGNRTWDYMIATYETNRVMTLLLQMRWDSYMFHQANLRSANMPTITVANSGATGRFGLAQQWAENIVGTLTKAVRWPIISAHMDVHHEAFRNRAKRDLCKPTLTLSIDRTASSSSYLKAIGFSVATESNCTLAITLPVPVLGPCGGCRLEQVGVDPLTVWVPMVGGAPPREFYFAREWTFGSDVV